jgi:hypothetical protein
MVGAPVDYLVVVGAGVAAFFFLLELCFLAGLVEVEAGAPAAGASAAIGAAVFGISAAIAAAAIPKAKIAEVIKDPDLFMRSPAGGINKRFEEYAGSVKFIRDEDHFTKAVEIPPGAEHRKAHSASRYGVLRCVDTCQYRYTTITVLTISTVALPIPGR